MSKSARLLVAAAACAAVAVFGFVVLADVRPAHAEVVCARETYPGHWFVTAPALVAAAALISAAFLERRRP